MCTVYVDSPLRILLQLKSPFGVRTQQVSHFLVIDLNIRCEHQELNVVCDRYCLEDVFEGPRYDTALIRRRVYALHRETLTASSLPVRKHRAVVTL